MHRIFIVEDDDAIAKTMEKYLETWGYQACRAEDFNDVLSAFVSFDPQLVLLDISLPFFNGYHWCREIRSVSKAPIIFISSASENMNIVMAMNMGGDDFIAKPFDLDVLIAKVQALLRRTYDFAGHSHLMECRGAVLNTSDATLFYDGKKMDLTKSEYRVIQLLMENRGRTVSRDAIMARLWENDSFVDENALTVCVTRLRRKLESAGLFDFIATKKGIGYQVG
ncbi:MAG: response regulator transcription factor [Clostridiales bacterium]|nr:response regulator transcription factor [Clostridiales bacterium]